MHFFVVFFHFRNFRGKLRATTNVDFQFDLFPDGNRFFGFIFVAVQFRGGSRSDVVNDESFGGRSSVASTRVPSSKIAELARANSTAVVANGPMDLSTVSFTTCVLAILSPGQLHLCHQCHMSRNLKTPRASLCRRRRHHQLRHQHVMRQFQNQYRARCR